MSRISLLSSPHRQLVDAPNAQLQGNWSSVANTSAQVVGGGSGLVLALPIVTGRLCHVKVKVQLYSTFGAGNSNVYGAIGAASSGLGNFAVSNIYAGGATSQAIWSNTGWVLDYDLSTQKYVSMTVQNDASSVISFSANAFRTSLLCEVYA